MVPRSRPPRLWGAARRRALGLCGVFEAPRAVSAVSTLLTEGSGSGAKQQPPVTGKVICTNTTSADNFYHHADPSHTTLSIGGLPAGQNASILTNKITSHANLNYNRDNINFHGVSSTFSSSSLTTNPNTDHHPVVDINDCENQDRPCFNSNSSQGQGSSSFYRMCNFTSETAATHLREQVSHRQHIEPINHNHQVEWHFALSQHRDMFMLLTDKCAAAVLH